MRLFSILIMCKSLLVTFRLKVLKYVRMKLHLFPVHRSHVRNSLVQPSFPPFLLFVLVFPTSSSVSFLPLVPPFPLFYFSHSPSPTSHCFLSFSCLCFFFLISINERSHYQLCHFLIQLPTLGGY